MITTTDYTEKILLIPPPNRDRQEPCHYDHGHPR